MERGVEETLASLRHKKSKSGSLSDRALDQTTIQRLETHELIFDAAPTKEREAFWSEQDQERADDITTEADFVEFITPYFSRVLSSCARDTRGCLGLPGVSTSNGLIPDVFATHKAMLRLAEWCGIWNILTLMGQHAPFSDRRSSWLINSRDSVVFKVQTAKWVDKGSRELLRSFMMDNTSPWVDRLNSICSSLGVDVVEGDAFLGRGAFGRVFKVTRQGQEFALKIVENRSIGRLYREMDAWKKAQHTDLTATFLELIETPSASTDDTTGSAKPLWAAMGAPRQGLVHGDPHCIECDPH
ncbi:hypothetical protein PHYSODRAFT_301661 [Phytophthora sojae]|uniref:Protein kinase domain-containing protein n=1 Tax=Phytophthora sojae (strain P6497) TaxID=1094619 RepID=G4ZK72_PHYSP|nr:hypothetical protein PHYSODRAFT_301661 [Phytophthora sojae]EGZ14876.1 hypothetical protein PHYSODRAFT_301661 [Phytophthora sojae]|eukprot:XP_009528625.1 hypothetical protein PHYSODRAFT_301661 [Phytophthora sojae]